MKNENINKNKNIGLKIGIIALSIFSTMLLIFNLLICATFKYKDTQIKMLSNSCNVTNVQRKVDNQSITDLTNYTWVGDNVVNLTGSVSYDIDFISNNTNYISISVNVEFRGSQMFYIDDNELSLLVGEGDGDRYGANITTWEDDAYKTIVIIGGDDATNSDLIAWLVDNGTLTENEPVIPDVPDTPDNPINYDIIEVVDISKLNPLIYWSSSLYNNGSLVQTPTNNIVNITGVEFLSNGFLFNKITIRTIALGGLNITLDNNVIDDNATTAYSGYSCFYNLTYTYESEERNYSIYVCGVGFHFLPHSTASSNYGSCVNPLEKTWVNEEYKNLNIVSASDEPCVVPAYSTLTGLELLKLQSDFTSSTLGDTNVFGLLSGAFSAFASILSIRIIPGISIGLLLFIPLVVSIVITIIKLIGK